MRPKISVDDVPKINELLKNKKTVSKIAEIFGYNGQAAIYEGFKAIGYYVYRPPAELRKIKEN